MSLHELKNAYCDMVAYSLLKKPFYDLKSTKSPLTFKAVNPIDILTPKSIRIIYDTKKGSPRWNKF